MMKLLCCLLGVMLLLSALAAHATDDMLIYSDRLNNGWGDNWSWMPHYPTNNPVYSGSNSMACVPSGSWQAWWLKSNTSLDTTIYTNVSFWLNGGATGGQSVLVSGELGGSGLPGIWVTAPTNTWKQFTISLAALGINNKTNLTGFQIGNGNSTQPFFIDEMQLVAAPAPATVHVGVLATQTVRKVDGKVFGINQVAWDGNVNTPASVALLNDMGNPCLRWPGGSWGDGYHWTNEYRGWGSYSSDFIALATNTHAQAFIIVNYGSGSPEEAAYGVGMFNVTNHCNFKYWEVGNEVGGSWETDVNTNAPWMPHDPWIYAMRFTNYYAQMKAVDPTIKIGAVADTTEDGTVNYTNHPVVNPRTGVTHNGWTPVMLAYLRTNNCIPDFLIEHNYGPTAGDTQDLLYSKKWASDAASLRQMLTDYLGSAGTNVTLESTENGTGGDKQCVSLTGGLFYADTIGQILQTEFNSRLWWDFRNGTSTLSNPDPAFYGWRTNSDGSILVDGGIVYGLGGVGGVGSAYPTYYVAKLMPYFAADGDTVVFATSDYPLLAVYSVKRKNGNLTLLVINKSSSSNLTAAINLSGYLPYTNATVYSYGIPQDTAARTGVGSPDIAQTNLVGVQSSFSVTFAPFSASVMVLSAANQPPFTPTGLTASSSNAAISLTWNTAVAADSYMIGRSTITGGPYANIASGVTATTYLDTGLINGTAYYYVVAATNTYGVSSNSAEASATPMIKFVGTVIGSPGSWGSLGNTITNVFDGNLNTYYDAVNGSGDWAGLDLGSGAAANVMQIRYCPRAGFASRMVGGRFQGANVADFSSGVVNLFTISSTPPDGVMTVQSVTNAASFRYLRYIGPAGGYCNVAEVEFWGLNAVVPPSAPTGLAAVAGDAVVNLTWVQSSSPGITTNKIYRSTNGSGGPYGLLASLAATTSYADTAVVDGSNYFYTVTAVSTNGESAMSGSAGATPLSAFQSWQVQYFGSTTNPLAAAGADPLGKGISNTNQFLLGLNPTNSASVFRILSATAQGNNVLITWAAAGVRTNMLQATIGDASSNYSSNFVDIPGSLTILPVAGDAVTNYSDLGGATNSASRFYRIRLIP